MKTRYYLRGALSFILVLVMVVSLAPVTLVSAAVEYSLWLDGTQVTSDNMRNIMGDGKTSFDPSTNTLTLNAPSNFGHSQDYMILSRLSNLTITGTFNQELYYMKTIAGVPVGIPTPYLPLYGIYATGILTLAGNFSFYGSDTGIVAFKDLTIRSGVVAVQGESLFTESEYGTGIDCRGKFTVANGATVTAVGKVNGLQYSSVSFGSNVNITEPKNHTLAKYTYEGSDIYVVCEGDGSDYAKRVVISEASTYELWLDSAQVTSANKNDILGDGKASFDPATNTLTLNEPTAFNNINDYLILSRIDNLTITGKFRQKDSDARENGIFSYGNLILSGDLYFVATTAVVNAKANVTVKAGSNIRLKATGSSSAGIACRGKLTVEDDIIKLEAEAGSTAIYMQSYSIGSTLGITTPQGGTIASVNVNGENAYTVMNTAGTAIAAKAVIEPHETIKYDLYFDQIQVTSDNMNNIFGDGKASFDPSTNTLTLNDPTIPKRTQSFIILSRLEELTIKGSYHMSTDYQTTYGLAAYGKVTLDGDFTFYASTVAIFVNNVLTVRSGTVKAVSNGDESIGIYVEKMIMTAGLTKIEAEAKSLAVLMTEYEVDESLGVTTPVDGCIFTINYNNEPSYTVLNYDRSEIAKKAVIEPHTKIKYDLYIDKKQVTSDNKGDIFGDGKATFDPVSNTLTLNDPAALPQTREYVIYSALDDLTVKGEFHMTSAYTPKYGIYADGNLTLDGNFTFYGTEKAVAALKDLTLKSGDLKAVATGSNSIGIGCFGTLYINNGVGTVEAEGVTTAVSLIYYDFGSMVEIVEPEGAHVYQMYEDVTKGSIFVVTGSEPVNNLKLRTKDYSLSSFAGSGTYNDPYQINTAEDWEKLGVYIETGGATASKYFKLMNDISVTTMIGTPDNPFAGVFEGNFKTLNVDLESDSVGCAPFARISGATIRMLYVAGKVKGGIHCSGLVGAVNGYNNTIQYCGVGVDITTGDGYCGGFIGHGGKYNTTISDSAFYGTINGAERAGTFWGWSDSGTVVTIKNCVDLSKSAHPIGLGIISSNSSISNTYYTYKNKIAGSGRPWAFSSRGKFAYTVSPGPSAAIYHYGTVGVQWKGNVYASAGETVTMHGYGVRVFSATAGTFKQNGSNLTLKMPEQDVIINIFASGMITKFTEVTGTAGNEGEGPENLVDGQTDTKWCVSEIKLPISITFKATGAIVPAGYVLTTANDTENYPGRNPVSWKLEGSNDKNNWTVLTEEQDNYTLEGKNNTSYSFGLTNQGTTRYQYFRFTVSKINDKTTFQLSGLYLFLKSTNTIKLEHGDHGTLTAYPGAAEGETVTVTANPENGYELAGITVKDASGNDVEVNGNTFVMPGQAVTVYAKWNRKGGIKGDINQDGEADSSDATYALRYDAGSIDLTDEQIAIGDINGDDEVDSNDASFILKYDSGAIDEL